VPTGLGRAKAPDTQQRGYRWTFLVSGLDDPNSTRIVADLTTARRDKLAAAATALSAPT
jgi:hypothetical protein